MARTMTVIRTACEVLFALSILGTVALGGVGALRRHELPAEVALVVCCCAAAGVIVNLLAEPPDPVEQRRRGWH
uniref:hypothetical protein n=1 Tax=Curtobacterium ammoniigenes TaxID=395387 RepID=UPI0035710B8D